MQNPTDMGNETEQLTDAFASRLKATGVTIERDGIENNDRINA